MEILHSTDGILPLYLMVRSHSTEYPQMYWWNPPHYWKSYTVLNIIQCFGEFSQVVHHFEFHHAFKRINSWLNLVKRVSHSHAILQLMGLSVIFQYLFYLTYAATRWLICWQKLTSFFRWNSISSEIRRY